VPLSDVTTISEEGLRSSDMLVVECDSEDIESQLHQFGDPGSTLGLCEVTALYPRITSTATFRYIVIRNTNKKIYTMFY